MSAHQYLVTPHFTILTLQYLYTKSNLNYYRLITPQDELSAKDRDYYNRGKPMHSTNFPMIQLIDDVPALYSTYSAALDYIGAEVKTIERWLNSVDPENPPFSESKCFFHVSDDAFLRGISELPDVEITYVDYIGSGVKKVFFKHDTATDPGEYIARLGRSSDDDQTRITFEKARD